MIDTIKKRYFLSFFDREPIEVTQEEWIKAERAAGFHPKLGCGPEATGGFGYGIVRGTIKYDN